MLHGVDGSWGQGRETTVVSSTRGRATTVGAWAARRLTSNDDYMEEKMWRSRGSNSEHRFDQRFDQRADPQPSDSSESSNSEYESDPCGSGDYDPDFGIFDDY